MFTDMVGFTALMQEDEAAALARRDKYAAVLHEQHKATGGRIVQYLGDGSLSIFDSALDAVRCAVEAQRAFSQAPEVPVRIGIHAGEVMVEPTGIVGDAVNVASRIESFGFPGGVTVSDSVHDQLKNQPAFAFVDLGKFKLKNVGRPFTIFAVAADGVAVPDSDHLLGKGERLVSLPANLPEPGSPLLGREADLAAITGLLREHRVVTITGPGGIGKTRAAIEVCRRLAPEFLGSICFVPLADVTDADDVVPALADALDVKEAEGRSFRRGVTDLIGERKALLLLDNLEQVIDAAGAIAEIVATCPQLRMLITSRGPLRIGAEHEYHLEPLAVPPAGAAGAAAPTDALTYPAVALFRDRARAVDPAFEVTVENAPAVTEVCRRLDGLPLAIELAAARTRLLTPEALLERLQHALDVLTGGRRDVPKRQQTLRAAIDWSHSLLTDAEQRLFRRLAVFPTSATFEAIDAICAEPRGSVLDDLESLVNKALVAVEGTRFSMLQTIREFAVEQLEASDEADAVAARHSAFYSALASRVGAGIESTEQLAWIERGIADEPNLLAAFDDLAARAASGDGAATERAMASFGDMWMYWHIRGKHLSARDVAARILAASPPADTRGRARLLLTAGLADWTLRHYERANEFWGEAQRIASELDDRPTIANAATCLAVGYLGFDLGEALTWSARAIELGRELNYPFALSQSLGFDGILHTVAGKPDTAKASYEEALAIQEPRGDHEGAGIALGGLAQLAGVRGDVATAIGLYERSRAAFEAVGDRAEEARVLGESAWVYLGQGDTDMARQRFRDSARAYDDVGSAPGVGMSVLGLAAVEAEEGKPKLAVTIASVAEVLAEKEGIVNVYSVDSPSRPYLEAAKATLSSEELAEAHVDGRNLSAAEVLAIGRR
jgi:predicted ATPase